MSEIDRLTGGIIEAAIAIHRDLGPGLLESVYETLLAARLGRLGLEVARQMPVRFTYDGMEFDEGFRVDLLVAGAVIVELKSVERLAPVHSRQVLTYLRLTGIRVGLLINFGEATLVRGVKRVVNDLAPDASSQLRVNRLPYG